MKDNKASNIKENIGLSLFTGEEYTFNLCVQRFCALILVRLLSAIYSFITDCDETFNYWEPTHFLLYGWGLQTWEYSPTYALRSYTYIGLHALVGKVISLFTEHKWLMFYGIRVALCLICTLCETKFLNSIHKNINPKVAHLTLLFLLFNSGMYFASAAFLPSSFAMYTTMLFTAKMIDSDSLLINNYERIKLCVFYIALGALLGWPFSGAVALPFIVNELYLNSSSSSTTAIVNGFTQMVNKLKLFFLASIRALVIIMIPMMAVEYFFYRKFSIAALNIVFYNIFNPDAGPDLYGTESWEFYFKNGFLNFNVILPIALLAPIITALALVIMYSDENTNNPHLRSYIKVFSTTNISIVWWLIFNIQPHKEERFLYVIYPLLCFNAAISLILLNTIFTYINTRFFKGKSQIITLFVKLYNFVFISSYITLSISRTLSQHRNYYGTISIYLRSKDFITSYSKPNDKFQMCIGSDWYRFPSHFLLPKSTESKFIKSNFDGLLPGYFLSDTDKSSTGWRSGSYHIPATLNNLNLEELDKYVPQETCDFFIGTELPINQSNITWSKLDCANIVDAEKSNTLGRAFLIPFLKFLPTSIRNKASKLYKYNSKDYCLFINDQSSIYYIEQAKHSPELNSQESEDEEL